MDLLAADVGKHGIGLSLWSRSTAGSSVKTELIRAFFHKRPAISTPTAWAEAAVSTLGELAGVPAKFWVETMLLLPYSRSRPADVLNLQGIAAALLGAFAARGAAVVGVTAPVWKGQVPRDVMGARVERKVRAAGWWDRVEVPRRATELNDVMHAVGLGAYGFGTEGVDVWA